MSTRDEIRSATVGSKKNFRKETLLYNGMEIEFRQPSIRLRKEIHNKSQVEGEDKDISKIDIWAYMVWSVIFCSFVPGTNDKIFEEGDYENLMEQPAGGFVDEFSTKISELLNVDVEKSLKNSAATVTDKA